MVNSSTIDRFPRLKSWFRWITFNKDKSIDYSKGMFENMNPPESCGWLSEAVSKMSWLEVTNMLILTSFLVRLPFFVRYLMNNKLDTGKMRCLHADDKSSIWIPALSLLGKFGVLYLANSGSLPIWSQMSPVNDTVARFGTFLGAWSVVLMLVAHCSLSASWSCNVAALKGQKMRVQGAYRCMRHPLYVSYLVQALAVLLISQNWLLGIACVPYVLHVFSKVKQEEVLLIEMFGQKYLDYMQQVPAFGKLSLMVLKRDCGLTENERQAALKLHQDKQQQCKDEGNSAKKE